MNLIMKKLAGPLIIIYFLVGMPNIERFTFRYSIIQEKTLR